MRSLSQDWPLSDPYQEELRFPETPVALHEPFFFVSLVNQAAQEMRKLLTLVDEHTYTCAEVKEMTARQLSNVRNRIRKMEKALAMMVSKCAGGDIPECPIVDTLSSLPAESKIHFC